MKTAKYALALAIAVLVLMVPNVVRADTVEINIIADGVQTGWVACPTTACGYVGPLGNYSLTLDLAIENNGGNPLLDLTYDASTSVADAGTITFEAIANGYTANITGTTLQANGNSTLGDTISISSYGGNNDNLCFTTSCAPGTAAGDTGSALLASIGPMADGAYNASATGGGNSSDPYSLGIVATLSNPTNSAYGNASGDIALGPVVNTPEPSVFLLLSLGLLMLIGTTWKSRIASRVVSSI